jgi:hypothetical protein
MKRALIWALILSILGIMSGCAQLKPYDQQFCILPSVDKFEYLRCHWWEMGEEWKPLRSINDPRPRTGNMSIRSTRGYY